MKRKRFLAMILATAITVGMAGCQKSPETSIVKNKDMDKLIEEAKKGDGDTAKVEDMKQYETYQTTIQDESLKVTVNVDAKVEIPQTDKLSVIRVKQAPISQEFLDKVKDKLIGKERLYDGCITDRQTKQIIESEIQYIKNEIAVLEKEGQDTEENKRDLNRLQKEYENAPATIDLKQNGKVSDGKIHSAAEMLEQNPNNPFYTWEHELNENGEVFYGITDEKDGTVKSLFVQNNERYGNCLRFHSGKQGYGFVASAMIEGTELSGGSSDRIWKDGESVPEEYVQSNGEIDELTEERATISEEDARKTADSFLKEIGLMDYEYQEGGLYNEVADIRLPLDGKGRKGYRKNYVFRYMRTIDGAPVIYSSESKYADGGEAYTKKIWSVESVEVRVNDDGIVGFSYNAPVELTDTVVDKSSLKPFEEIKKVFESMVVVTNAMEGVEKVMTVDKVMLGYTRISEADSFDTGLLVPVWEFQGKEAWGDVGGEYSKTILTINAIDGSVINRALGY